MIATWMLYTAVIGGLLSIAALALERALSALRLPTRFVWLVATMAAILWPTGAAIARLFPAPTRATRVMPFTIAMESASGMVIRAGADRAVFIDRGLVAAWAVVSGLLLLRLAQAVVALHRRRREWRAALVDGMNVQLSPNIGPAVVGLATMDVVIPEWIMTLDAPLRAIVLRHEQEHRHARDPYLLFASAVAVALMPWNVALWLQARRLRLAIELDCDARVLRAHPSPERYGMLMLTIAQRRSIAPPMFAPMLSEPTSQLERRILAMRPSPRHLTRLTVGAGTLVAASSLFFACALQSENPVAPRPSAKKEVAFVPNQTYFEFQVTKAVQVVSGRRVEYPASLRAANIEGAVLAQFVVDAQGVPDMSSFKVLKSSHDLFTAAVLTALRDIRFSPAELNGQPVKQLVQMPFQFNLSKGGTTLEPLRSSPEAREPAKGARPRVSATGPTPVRDDQTFFEFQVERPATPKPSTSRPRYPDALRAANIEGEVLAQFVVDTSGAVVMETFKVLKTSDDQFTDAVRKALPQMRFDAAQVGGRPVKQLLQMPFTFSLSK